LLHRNGERLQPCHITSMATEVNSSALSVERLDAEPSPTPTTDIREHSRLGWHRSLLLRCHGRGCLQHRPVTLCREGGRS
jgi:hypothetical protein